MSGVRVPAGAPRQNKAARSCGGTSTATSTGDLVFPFPSQTHSVGLCDGTGSNLNCPGAPKWRESEQDSLLFGGPPTAGKDPLRSNLARGSYPPLSRSPHEDLKPGSDLDCPGAPRQNKAEGSCGGTNTAISTAGLVFPFPSQTHSVGLRYGIGSDTDCPCAPKSQPFH